MSETYETIQRRPEYIEQREQALLDKIFGTESGGVFTGGLIDAEAYPDLFKIPEYKIAPILALKVCPNIVNSVTLPP